MLDRWKTRQKNKRNKISRKLKSHTIDAIALFYSVAIAEPIPFGWSLKIDASTLITNAFIA